MANIRVNGPLTPIRESWKKKSKSREMSKRHSCKKHPAKIPKTAFWEMSKHHFWKINPDLKSGLDFFSRNDAYSFPKIRFFPKVIKIIEMMLNG